MSRDLIFTGTHTAAACWYPSCYGREERVQSCEIFSRPEKFIARFFFPAENMPGGYEDNLGLRFQRILSSTESFSALQITAVLYRVHSEIEHLIDSFSCNISKKCFRHNLWMYTCLDVYYNYYIIYNNFFILSKKYE